MSGDFWASDSEGSKEKEKILITSALPYVNNTPHLGNIIGCVLSGDVYARYCRQRQHEVLYICGTDEYGTATETKALKEGLSPQQICDKYYEVHKKVYDWFNIQFDKFGRTTTNEQTEICQDIFLKIKKNGYVFIDTMQQLLCEKCSRFLADRLVEGVCPFCSHEGARGDQCDKCGRLINVIELKEPRCIICSSTPIVKESQHYFLDLPKIEPKLKEWMSTISHKWSNNAKVIAESWIKDGLKPRCITRDLKWGIPVPGDELEDKVFYVWFDAPIGYLSITKQLTPKWKEWWMGKDVTLVQFMAKDNVPFHSVIFPSCLLATGEDFNLVGKLFATEYLNYEGEKFSKSRGVGVFGTDLFEIDIDPDIWRFYLVYIRPENQDSNFSWTDLAVKNNSDLLNNLGNFINRVLKFIQSNFESKIPKVTLNKTDNDLIISINEELARYNELMGQGKLREGLRAVLSISRLGNQYMQGEKPWVLVKDAATKERGSSVCGLCCNLVALICGLLEPFMPQYAQNLFAQLNKPEKARIIPDRFTSIFVEGDFIGVPEPLFKKIDEAPLEKLRLKFSGL